MPLPFHTPLLPAVCDPIANALAEDIGAGDLTSHYFVDPARHGTGRIIAKQAGVLAGVGTAAEVFLRVSPALQVEVLRQDGDTVAPGEVVLTITGPVAALLTAERVALNFLQQLSGVATQTRHFVEAIAGTGARLLDTRKTTPGLRALEKAAVVAGGGTNHRLGLFDMVMVKDNHVAATDLAGLRAALLRFRQEHPGIRVEVEADTLKQVRGFLTLSGIDIILLDNMSLEDLRQAVLEGQGKGVQFEASGGVNLQNVRSIAETGVDWISVGALTHSSPALDFSLDLVES